MSNPLAFDDNDFDGVDFNEVDTSMPLLPAGNIEVVVKSVEKVPSKKTRGGFNILVTFATTESIEAENIPGKMIEPGYTLRTYMPMQNPPDAKPGYDFRENICRLIDALYSTDQGNRPAINPPTWVGERCLVKVGIAEMKDEAGNGTGMSSNEIKRFYPAA